MAEDKRQPGPEDIAADDAGGSILGSKTGETAGGTLGFGYAPPEQEQPQGDIAADDAGGTAKATQIVTNADVEE